jgi:hypothetical protein
MHRLIDQGSIDLKSDRNVQTGFSPHATLDGLAIMLDDPIFKKLVGGLQHDRPLVVDGAHIAKPRIVGRVADGGTQGLLDFLPDVEDVHRLAMHKLSTAVDGAVGVCKGRYGLNSFTEVIGIITNQSRIATDFSGRFPSDGVLQALKFLRENGLCLWSEKSTDSGACK